VLNKLSSQKAIELSKEYDYMYAMIGVHPHDVETDTAQDIYDIYQKNKSDKIVAIGEIGLDYAFVKNNKEKQFKLFIEQIELANTLKLPISIHTRDASLDTYSILKENKPRYGALLHCFKPTDDLMKLVLEENYYVAFGGNITYKRSKSFGEYLKKIPISQIVLETDSPYLTPIPYKGEINDSSNLPIICDKLAEYLELEKEELAKIVYQNSIDFFNINKKEGM
jgi:TatD DNase family protein